MGREARVAERCARWAAGCRLQATAQYRPQVGQQVGQGGVHGDKDAKRLVPTEQEGERGNGSMAASRAHVISAACCSACVDADSRSWKRVGRRSAAKEENLEMLQGVSSLVALIEVVLRFPAL